MLFILSLTLVSPPETTTVCMKSQGPWKPRGSVLCSHKEVFMKNKFSSLFEMYKPHNNKTTRGKQKTKYSNGSKYFYDNPIIRLPLAVSFSLSFSSLQHKFISGSRSWGRSVFKHNLSTTWPLPKTAVALHPLITCIKTDNPGWVPFSPLKQPLLSSPWPFMVEACDEHICTSCS